MRRAIVLLTLTSLNACASPTESEEPTIRIQVQGTVTAADDGSPIAGAVLEVYSIDAGLQLDLLARDTTDASGDYSLSFVVAMNCPLFRMDASHPGFREQYISILGLQNIHCTEELQTIDIQLQREST